MTTSHPDCPLCAGSGGEVLFADGMCRVVLITGDEALAFPGFCRVIWKHHVREMSDLDAVAQRHLLEVVLATEIAVRELQQPDKMNLASLGNVVPHLHWHVIPRWRNDSHFPAPIWAAAVRSGAARPSVDAAILRTRLEAMLRKRKEELS